MSMVGEAWGLEETISIPLLGNVAAGVPLDIVALDESLDVPRSMWHGRRVFALRVRGESMVEAGIRDGDYLIVEACESPDDGRTVVAEIDGAVTVKKLFRDADGGIRLQPANAAMLPLVVRGERVTIVGVVAGILRKYGFGARGATAASASAALPGERCLRAGRSRTRRRSQCEHSSSGSARNEERTH